MKLTNELLPEDEDLLKGYDKREIRLYQEIPINEFRSTIERVKLIYSKKPADLERVQKIVDTIKEGNNAHPFLAFKKNDNTLSVFHGFHRLIAFDKLSMNIVPVMTITVPDDLWN